MPYKMNKGDAIIRETIKPSSAAMELAEALFPDFTPEIHVGYADIIHSHMRDLLEKASQMMMLANCDEHCSKKECKYRALAAALEPWKDGK